LGAPSVVRTGDVWTAAWTDGAGLYLGQVAAAGVAAPAQALPSGTRSPWNPVLMPAPDDGWHLIWQDLDLFSEPHLYSARLHSDGTLLRGPIQLSQKPVSAVSISPGYGLDVILVWADASPQPDLHGTRLDTQGRPTAGPPALVARNAAWPALNRLVDGRWALTWLSMPDSLRRPPHSRITHAQITTGPLPWSEETAQQVNGEIILLDTSDFIESAQLGLDQHYGYLFIGHRNAESGLPHTDTWVFPLDEATRSPSSALITDLSFPVSTAEDAPQLTTGFNTGPAFAFTGTTGRANDAPPLPAGRPATPVGQYTVLPVVFATGEKIVIGYFQDGAAAGYQPIIDQATAVGQIGLWVNRDRHLHLAWANAPELPGGPAALLLSGTHPILRDMPADH